MNNISPPKKIVYQFCILYAVTSTEPVEVQNIMTQSDYISEIPIKIYGSEYNWHDLVLASLVFVTKLSL